MAKSPNQCCDVLCIARTALRGACGVVETFRNDDTVFESSVAGDRKSWGCCIVATESPPGSLDMCT